MIKGNSRIPVRIFCQSLKEATNEKKNTKKRLKMKKIPPSDLDLFHCRSQAKCQRVQNSFTKREVFCLAI